MTAREIERRRDLRNPDAIQLSPTSAVAETIDVAASACSCAR
jgi:hypothetical protein